MFLTPMFDYAKRYARRAPCTESKVERYMERIRAKGKQQLSDHLDMIYRYCTSDALSFTDQDPLTLVQELAQRRAQISKDSVKTFLHLIRTLPEQIIRQGLAEPEGDIRRLHSKATMLEDVLSKDLNLKTSSVCLDEEIATRRLEDELVFFEGFSKNKGQPPANLSALMMQYAMGRLLEDHIISLHSEGIVERKSLEGLYSRYRQFRQGWVRPSPAKNFPIENLPFQGKKVLYCAPFQYYSSRNAEKLICKLGGVPVPASGKKARESSSFAVIGMLARPKKHQMPDIEKQHTYDEARFRSLVKSYYPVLPKILYREGRWAMYKELCQFQYADELKTLGYGQDEIGYMMDIMGHAEQAITRVAPGKGRPYMLKIN